MALLVASFAAQAQDNENEFQRIATRVMQQYDDPDILPDSTAKNGKWDGGAYLGVASNGRVMPSANFRYKKNKIVFTGDVAIDLLERNSDKVDDTRNYDNSAQVANTDIHNKGEQADASLRLDYYPTLSNCFSFGVLENFSHSKSNEDAMTSFFSETGADAGTTVQQQENNTRNLKLGALMQWKHLFADKGLLLARMNLRYLYQKISVEEEDWDMLSQYSVSNAQEKWNKFTPYGQVSYASPTWSGFNFTVQEKFTLEDMKVEDIATDFRYNSSTSATTLNLNYKVKALRLFANAGYEYYNNKIDDVKRSYNDWVLKAGIAVGLPKGNGISFTFNRFFKRPTYMQLYDKKHLGSSLGTYYIGNRDLDPSLTSQYKLAFNLKPAKNLSVDLSVMYEDIDRDITKISGYDEAEKTSYKTWINDAKYDNIHIGMDGKWVVGPMDLRWHVNVKYLNYQGENVNGDRSWSWSFKIRPEFALGAGWIVAGALYYSGREEHRTYTDAPYTYVSVRAVKEIGPWALYTFVQDIFERRHQETTYSTTNLVITRTNENARAAIIGASYTF